MKLQTLKPRLATLKSNMPSLSRRIDATPRTRGRRWQERREAWLRLHPLCEHCKAAQPPRVTVGEEVDHRIPLWKRGPDDDTNLQTLCKPHHAVKTAAEAKERARG